MNKFKVDGRWVDAKTMRAIRDKKLKAQTKTQEVKPADVVPATLEKSGEKKPEDMTRDELKKSLTAKGVKFKGNASNAVLKELIVNSEEKTPNSINLKK